MHALLDTGIVSMAGCYQSMMAPAGQHQPPHHLVLPAATLDVARFGVSLPCLLYICCQVLPAATLDVARFGFSLPYLLYICCQLYVAWSLMASKHGSGFALASEGREFSQLAASESSKLERGLANLNTAGDHGCYNHSFLVMNDQHHGVGKSLCPADPSLKQSIVASFAAAHNYIPCHNKYCNSELSTVAVLLVMDSGCDTTVVSDHSRVEEASLLLPTPRHRDHELRRPPSRIEYKTTDSKCVQRNFQTFGAVADSRQKGYVNGKGFGMTPPALLPLGPPCHASSQMLTAPGGIDGNQRDVATQHKPILAVMCARMLLAT
jgi:hypothetical protein